MILNNPEKAWILLPILILIILLTYTQKTLKLIDSWKMRKINYLSTLHDNELLTEDIQKMLKDEINNAAFQSIHGFRAGTLLREQLTNLHNQDRDRFTWRRIRMANSYIEAGEKEVVVKIGWFAKITAILSILGLITIILLYIMSWIYLILQKDWHALITIAISAILFFIFVFQLAQYRQATLLKKAINELKGKEKI